LLELLYQVVAGAYINTPHSPHQTPSNFSKDGNERKVSHEGYQSLESK